MCQRSIRIPHFPIWPQSCRERPLTLGNTDLCWFTCLELTLMVMWYFNGDSVTYIRICCQLVWAFLLNLSLSILIILFIRSSSLFLLLCWYASCISSVFYFWFWWNSPSQQAANHIIWRYTSWFNKSMLIWNPKEAGGLRKWSSSAIGIMRHITKFFANNHHAKG